ncbi:MAG: GNAT family N-acetyltransferase, partial [Prevotellaceae bacterium]|nr:GNAT family N-acetyltransferase [Prevotellaceae bacterium]
REEDAAAIAAIYSYYITHTVITFEAEPVTADEMRERIVRISSEYPYFVYEKDGAIAGYSYAAQWKKRSAYCHTVESAVYVSHRHMRQGIGTALMGKLIEALAQMRVHAVVACIAIPNDESIALHERLGFTRVSHFREVGRKFERWLDVGDWELVLENQ